MPSSRHRGEHHIVETCLSLYTIFTGITVYGNKTEWVCFGCLFRLGQKRGVQGPRRRRNPNKNPLRALAERPDLISEYTEVKSGVAEREVKRINLEKGMQLIRHQLSNDSYFELF